MLTLGPSLFYCTQDPESVPHYVTGRELQGQSWWLSSSHSGSNVQEDWNKASNRSGNKYNRSLQDCHQLDKGCPWDWVYLDHQELTVFWWAKLKRETRRRKVPNGKPLGRAFGLLCTWDTNSLWFWGTIFYLITSQKLSGSWCLDLG